MEKLQRVAFLSVGRAVGFAGLAIFTLMVGLCFDPLLSLRSGGVLLLLLVAVLLLKAYRVDSTNYRRTETWLLLDSGDRPDERFAGRAVSGALRDAFLWFAHWTAGLAALVWGFAIALMWFGGADLAA